MKLKRIFVILLSLIFALGAFTGCREREDDNYGSADYASGVTVDKKSSTSIEIYQDSKEGKEQIYITVQDAGYGTAWLNVIASHFVKDNPEYWVFINADAAATSTITTTLNAGVSDSLSDVYMMGAKGWQNWALDGWIEELSDVYNAKPDGENSKTVYEKLQPYWQSYCTTDGKTADGVKEGKYVYPWADPVTGICYNEKMFKEYNWAVPETVDELIALCEQIKEDTNGEIAPFSLYNGYAQHLVYTYWMQLSGIDGIKEFFSFPSPEAWNPDTQPGAGMKGALEIFTSILGTDKKNTLAGSIGRNQTEAQLSFIRGEAAMILGASWVESEMREDIKVAENCSIRLMPYPTAGGAKTDANGNALKVTYAAAPEIIFVPAKIESERKERAKEFLAYISGERMLQLSTKYMGSLRPFEYDLDAIKGEVSDFINDCIKIKQESETFTRQTTSNLNLVGASDFVYNVDPCTLLLIDSNMTAEKFCRQNYNLVKNTKWAQWQADIEIKLNAAK